MILLKLVNITEFTNVFIVSHRQYLNEFPKGSNKKIF